MELQYWVQVAAKVMEVGGVATLLGGAAIAIGVTLVRGVRRPDALEEFRRDLGRAILLGLEFLVAADIIRTVAEVPTLESVAVLGGIVIIRTFLSFTLEVELVGRWPWQKRTEGPA